MAFSRFSNALLKAVLVTALCTTSGLAARKYDRRSDLEAVQPISESGWFVPLFVTDDALPAPSNGKVLTTLAVGRGTTTYNCSENSSNVAPTFTSQAAELYDVAPLVQLLGSVAGLNDFTNAFQKFDYSELNNSTLICIGRLQSSEPGDQTYDLTTTISNLYVTKRVGLASAMPEKNIDWEYLTDDNGKSEVYMVETTGGQAPVECGGQNATIVLPFTAEFWFYE